VTEQIDTLADEIRRLLAAGDEAALDALSSDLHALAEGARRIALGLRQQRSGYGAVGRGQVDRAMMHLEGHGNV
jgi:hypothetical protein